MSQELGKKPKKAGEVEVKRIQNFNTAMVKVLVTWLCLTLCKPMNCSPPGSSVHGILQAGTLERAAIFLPPGGRPSPVIQPGSPALLADSLPSEPPGKPSRWTCHLGHDTWFR